MEQQRLVLPAEAEVKTQLMENLLSSLRRYTAPSLFQSGWMLTFLLFASSCSVFSIICVYIRLFVFTQSYTPASCCPKYWTDSLIRHQMWINPHLKITPPQGLFVQIVQNTKKNNSEEACVLLRMRCNGLWRTKTFDRTSIKCCFWGLTDYNRVLTENTGVRALLLQSVGYFMQIFSPHLNKKFALCQNNMSAAESSFPSKHSVFLG